MSTVLDHPEAQLAEEDYHAFNKAVWDSLCDNPFFADIPYQIETNKHGHIVMSPPPAPSHGSWQSRIVRMLDRLDVEGEIMTECPISTRMGVKGADVAWCSDRLWKKYGKTNCFLDCPELCVEVLSPRNSRSEISEKKSLYFEEGAKEVWICTQSGQISFDTAPDTTVENSILFPEFPQQLKR